MLLLVFVASLTGCELLQPLVTEDVEMDNEWVGGWSLESINGESFENFFAVDDEVVATVTDNHWSFEADGNWYAKMVVTISNDEQGSIFRSETVLKLAGTYSLAGERYTFTLTQGGLFFEASDEVDTGTWETVDDRLILHSDDGEIVVFTEAE